jgi:hypothetical protein
MCDGAACLLSRKRWSESRPDYPAVLRQYSSQCTALPRLLGVYLPIVYSVSVTMVQRLPCCTHRRGRATRRIGCRLGWGWASVKWMPSPGISTGGGRALDLTAHRSDATIPIRRYLESGQGSTVPAVGWAEETWVRLVWEPRWVPDF